ncbi:MAG: hypothetical protein ACTSRG_02420 [Candidatus Helarchaeota archaeon]
MSLEEIPTDSEDFSGPNYVIRKMSLPHCARGPKECEKCAEAAKDIRIYLLKTYPDPGTMTRPIIEINVHGNKIWQVYDVINDFESEEKAKDYANKKGFKLIEETN